MLNLFLMFNSIVLEYSTALLTAFLGVLVSVFALGLFVAALATLFASAFFIPTGKKIFLKMFEFADIKPGDKVYDLGCGDGRFIFEAERRGAKAVGVELNLGVYLLALLNKKRLDSKSIIIRGNLFQVDLKDADVVFCYLMPKPMIELDDKFKQELKKGCRIISHSFPIREGRWTNNILMVE